MVPCLLLAYRFVWRGLRDEKTVVLELVKRLARDLGPLPPIIQPTTIRLFRFGASAMLSSKLVKGAELKIYRGVRHKRRSQCGLSAFFKSS